MHFSKLNLLILVAAMAACDDPASSGAAGGTGGAGGDGGAGGSGASSGGGGAGLTGGSGGGPGGGGQAGATQNKCPAYTAKGGKGSATYKDFEGKAQAVNDLPEIGCRTLRKRDGSVVGIQASFGKFDPSISPVIEQIQEKIARFQLVYTGPYTGDGALTGQAMLEIRKGDGSSFGGGATSVTVSDGGKTFKVVGQDAELNFTCDATDDVAPTAGQPLTDAPGRIIVENANAAAVAIDGIKCDENGGFEIGYTSLGVDPDCLPTAVHLTMPPSVVASSPGSYDLEDGSYVLVDLVTFGRVNVAGADKFSLTAVKPAKGTVGVGGGTSLDFKASFTCPAP